jgi:hypothetical protein
MSAIALRVEDTTVRDSVVSVLRRHNLKLVAQAGDVGPDTAKNWIEGRNAPALGTAINLARQIPELRAELIRLMSPDAEYEAEFMQDFIRLADTYARIKASKAQA